MMLRYGSQAKRAGTVLAVALVGSYAWSGVNAWGTAKAAEKVEKKASLEIAVVDMQRAILQTDEGKAAKVKIEKEAQTKRDDLLKQQEDLNTLGQEFQSQQAVLTEETRLEKQKELQGKMQALRTSQVNFEQEVRRREMEETQKIIESLQKIIDEISRKEGYELVFEKGAGALLYASAVDDITEQIVKIFNERSKGKTAKADSKKAD